MFEDNNEIKKRKSFSFCAKEDPIKDINLFQNALGGESNSNKLFQDSKSKF